jgi:glycine/D-amino acid oxidase-like deaminating enzyme
MATLSGKPISFWIDSTPTTHYPSSGSNISVDVAIIGGGIVGITAATLLKRAGKTVAVIESRQIITGVSGHTTAKVTSLHQLIYADLIKQVGEQKARLYAESNQAAIERVAAFVAEEQIECDFSRRSAYTFTESEDELSQIKDEVEAALKLGLPASFVREQKNAIKNWKPTPALALALKSLSTVGQLRTWFPLISCPTLVN